MRQRLTARQRLKLEVDFAAVKRTGRRMDCGPFIIMVRVIPATPSQRPLRRLGVIASRKVGPAVKRNRAKRLFREIFRLNQEVLPSRTDILIIARTRFDQFSFQKLQNLYIGACLKLAPLSLPRR